MTAFTVYFAFVLLLIESFSWSYILKISPTVKSIKLSRFLHTKTQNNIISNSNFALQTFPDPSILPTFYEAFSLNAIQAIVLKGINQKFLTDSGLIHSTLLGIGLWTFLGFKGWLVCVIYLIFGNIVTKVRMKEKEVRLIHCHC